MAETPAWRLMWASKSLRAQVTHGRTRAMPDTASSRISGSFHARMYESSILRTVCSAQISTGYGYFVPHGLPTRNHRSVPIRTSPSLITKPLLAECHGVRVLYGCVGYSSLRVLHIAYSNSVCCLGKNEGREARASAGSSPSGSAARSMYRRGARSPGPLPFVASRPEPLDLRCASCSVPSNAVLASVGCLRALSRSPTRGSANGSRLVTSAPPYRALGQLRVL